MIKHLTLTSYRNHKHARLNTEAQIICFIGPNGSGKTNILEAISYFAPGRGLRRAAMQEVATYGSDGAWAVSALLHSEYVDIKLGTGISPQALLKENLSREVKIDGKKCAKQNSLLEHIRMLWLIPAMDGLFTGPSADRRRFLDRWVTTIEAGHAYNLSQYEKAMRQRNKALEMGGRNQTILDSLEDMMANHAIAIALARHNHVQKLSHIMMASQQSDDVMPQSIFPWAKMALQGTIEADINEGDTLTALEDRYRKRLFEERALDKDIGRTASGPHRSDFFLWHGPKSTEARLCSTGEQKALLIGLLLAQLELLENLQTQASRILLLDEVAAHLDKHRRRALFERLSQTKLQVWMTGTDEDVFEIAHEDKIFFFLDEMGKISTD